MLDSPIGLQYAIGDEEHPITAGSYSGIDRSVPPNTFPSGVCRFCGCHGDSCQTKTGDLCEWTDATRTCCTANGCTAQLAKLAGTHPTPNRPRPTPDICSCSVCSGRTRGKCRRAYYR